MKAVEVPMPKPMLRWTFTDEPSARERRILERVRKKRKLFAFLREHRHELFDEAFQVELEQMYRDTGAGKQPVPPALMAMVLLLQGYLGVSDSDAVELAACDARWQLVLGGLDEEPPFSQGALFDFRQRLIAHDMDLRLLERTRELAKRTGAFDWKKLPGSLRVAVDSSPLHGAGRVEDAINLLAHAARKVVLCIAQRKDRPVELLAQELGIPLLAESSMKKALDVDWNDEAARNHGLNRMLDQIERLERWVRSHLGLEAEKSPLREHLALLRQLREQDLEPDPSGGGKRIKQGVAKDRRISIEDADMRHGRKTKTKAFNGYKRHIAVDLDTRLILGAALAPANQPELEILPPIWSELDKLGVDIGELHIDRGYIGSPLLATLGSRGVTIFCKPWAQRNGELFAKTDFHFDLRARTVTCPAGQTERFEYGQTVEFEADSCDVCPQRARCTTRNPGRGRHLHIARDERLQIGLRKLVAVASGRAKLRERVGVEHRLAHVGQRQGTRARYRGTRKNLYDLRRAATIENLQIIRHQLDRQELALAA